MSRNFSELTCQEFCTPPVKGVKNSVRLPLEVSGIPNPSLRILYPSGPLNNERLLRWERERISFQRLVLLITFFSIRFFRLTVLLEMGHVRIAIYVREFTEKQHIHHFSTAHFEFTLSKLFPCNLCIVMIIQLTRLFCKPAYSRVSNRSLEVL